MQEDIKNQIKSICKRLDKMAQESHSAKGYCQQTARLRLLAEVVREQTEVNEIPVESIKKLTRQTDAARP